MSASACAPGAGPECGGARVLHGLLGDFDPQETLDIVTAAAVLKHAVLSEQQTDVHR